MYTPKSYKIVQLPIQLIINNDYEIYSKEIESFDTYYVTDFYAGQATRIILNLLDIPLDEPDRIDELILIDLSNTTDDDLDELYDRGFMFNGRKYYLSERGASMARHNIISAIEGRIIRKFKRAALMDIDTSKKFVISKIQAYIGLLFSSCHTLENFRPYIVIVPDLKRTIPNQMVSFCREETAERNGKKYTQMKLVTEKQDLVMNLFDGGGIHSPKITQLIQKLLKIPESPTSIMWRAPLIKGMTHECDFISFAAERGIAHMTDIWGKKHSVTDVDIIMTESMYKGFKFFCKYNDYRDWELYWQAFDKYNHAFGVAKWNYAPEEEPVYTRLNYQVLQDIDVSGDEFVKIADFTKDLFQKIAAADDSIIWNFAGLTYKTKKDSETGLKYLSPPQTDDCFFKAILKNTDCLQDEQIQKHFYGLTRKYIDEMKCGKVYVKSSFRFLVPDLVALMEHAFGLSVQGCLKYGECFTQSVHDGIYDTEVIIERNPHLAKSEHCVLQGTDNELCRKWLGHLYNCVFLNTYDITCSRLSGADYDGDLGLVIKSCDCPIMRRGIDTTLPIVINIDEKATAIAEDYTAENIKKNIKFARKQKIGEMSNMDTCYDNKVSDNPELRRKWDEFSNIICICNAKEIDSVKTQVRVRVPRMIQKYAKPFPYFMRYAGDYYKRHKHFNMALSNMNRLCYNIEDWQKNIIWKRDTSAFDYSLYMNPNILIEEEKVQELISIYREYAKAIRCKKSSVSAHKHRWLQSEVRKKKKQCEKNGKPFDEKRAIRSCLRVYTPQFIDYKPIQDAAKDKCLKVIPDLSELATYLVYICYERIKTADKGFAWLIAGEGIVDNLKSVPHNIPLVVGKNEDFDFEYLGRFYKWQLYVHHENQL